MYSGGTIFVIMQLGISHCTSTYIKTSKETMEDKQRFENEIFQYGIVVQRYHTDIGIFAT
jgi:hypothetical protein